MNHGIGKKKDLKSTRVEKKEKKPSNPPNMLKDDQT